MKRDYLHRTGDDDEGTLFLNGSVIVAIASSVLCFLVF